jgi:hypothetical protein
LSDEADELLLIHSTTLQQQPARRTQGTFEKTRGGALRGSISH